MRSIKVQRGARILVVAAAALAAGLGVMSPAYASTTRDGCTVQPVTPYHNGTFTSGGEKWINYDVTITCSAGRSVQLVMDRMEADSGLNGADDFIGMSDTIKTFNASDTITWRITGVLPDNDGGLDQYSEMYHQVGFQVTINGSAPGAWTNWEKSGTRSIHV
jgi:hypothetical protein